MSKLKWDEIGKKFYQTGVSNTVLFPQKEDGTYETGVAWSGVTTITESPSGAESTPVYADNIKYLNLVSAEEYGSTIEAYTFPEEFAECDGSAEVAEGVRIGQQQRKQFGLAYKSLIGNDTKKTAYGYKLHLVYNALAAPSEKSHQTVNDSTEAETMSWEISTTPVDVTGYDPTASLEIDSTTIDADALKKIEDIIFGTEEAESRLPLPDEIISIIKGIKG